MTGQAIVALVCAVGLTSMVGVGADVRATKRDAASLAEGRAMPRTARRPQGRAPPSSRKRSQFVSGLRSPRTDSGGVVDRRSPLSPDACRAAPSSISTRCASRRRRNPARSDELPDGTIGDGGRHAQTADGVGRFELEVVGVGTFIPKILLRGDRQLLFASPSPPASASTILSRCRRASARIRLTGDKPIVQ
jgi:hypothetical protein